MNLTFLKQQRLPTNSFTKTDTYRKVRLPVDQASTLIPDAYTSDDFFALEQEKIFSNTKTSTLEVPWKINNVESGVYFAKVDVENDQQTSKKIIKVGIIK